MNESTQRADADDNGADDRWNPEAEPSIERHQRQRETARDGQPHSEAAKGQGVQIAPGGLAEHALERRGGHG